jgi:poly [ADP-ribose] polymerase
VEWLIKSIQNKTPESVQKYLLKPKKEKPAIALKGKKRGRESGPEDEPDTASKKAKDEEKINYKRLVELVDEDFDIPR